MNSAFRSVRNFFTGRVFLALLSLSLAAIVAFGILPGIYKDQTATVQIVRIVQSLQPGDEIQAQHFEIVEVGAFNIPQAALRTREEVQGKFAKMPMRPGDFVFLQKISDFRFTESLDMVIENGLKLITVTPKASAQAVSAHLAPGDVVSIAAITDVRQPNGEIQRIVSYPGALSHVTVYDVESSRGLSLQRDDLAENGPLNSASATNSDDLVPKTITFIVSDEQVTALLQAEYNGGFHIIFKERLP